MTTRALVLGGGGPVGVAWESGLISGFARAGVDLGQADFVMGTSAGSIVGARLASGVAAAQMADSLLVAPEAPPAGSEGGARPAPDLGPLMQLMAAAQSGVRNPAEARRELGAYALAAQTSGEESFLRMIGRSFPEGVPRAWPGCDFACTAVDAGDGGFQLWVAQSEVELARAVAASCSVPGVFPPVELKGRRYMDGGVRSPTNADLATGHDVVVVVALRAAGAEWMSRRLDEEVESLQAGGATVVVVTPDDGSLTAFGSNLMDFNRSAAVARAGLAQGAAQAAVLKQVWG